jgi:hypothetical protein
MALSQLDYNNSYALVIIVVYPPGEPLRKSAGKILRRMRNRIIFPLGDFPVW